MSSYVIAKIMKKLFPNVIDSAHERHFRTTSMMSIRRKRVNCPNDISLSRTNQSQAKFKSAVGENLLQSWVNLTNSYSLCI